MIDLAIFLASLAGFAGLLLASPRHQQEWLRSKLAPRACTSLRLSGFLLLTSAFVVAGRSLGWGYGAVVWLGWLTIAAALVVIAHTNRERIVAKVRR
ncbi:DUF3325 domain-containing protein [Novosphingobium resinovorum]|uniref:DUF3325 domain-containing protein n=1 Tax=Novosphingobium resinovorum TaxID=158500 RepID=UPI002ED4CB07|nr:DUF3325 domain-containing protein [Novosphingobium resinovorum]